MDNAVAYGTWIQNYVWIADQSCRQTLRPGSSNGP